MTPKASVLSQVLVCVWLGWSRGDSGVVCEFVDGSFIRPCEAYSGIRPDSIV
jgi:hypothetical protein